MDTLIEFRRKERKEEGVERLAVGSQKEDGGDLCDRISESVEEEFYAASPATGGQHVFAAHESSTH